MVYEKWFADHTTIPQTSNISRNKSRYRENINQKSVEIIEAELCPDHVHMLISVPPKYSVSQMMGYLKGKSSLMIFDRHANLKYKYGILCRYRRTE